jgi:allophanate hydrolase subunit 2
MGVRLEGHALVPTGGADIISEGLVTGAIQVTGEGQPIVMMAARATIGGYPKIATVIAADLDRLGQLRPGQAVRFVEATDADLANGSTTSTKETIA